MGDIDSASGSAAVRIDFDAIVTAWENAGEVWVEMAPDRAVEPELFDAMGTGLEAANDAQQPEDGFGSGVHGTVAGGATKLKYPPSEEALRDWLTVFGREVGAAGWGGSVRPAAAIRRLDWLVNLTAPQLTAFVSYEASSGGGLRPEVCAAAARWGRQSGGPEAFLLSSALTLPDGTGELGNALTLALSRSSSIAACYASRQPGRASRISLGSAGFAAYQVYDPESAPLALAASARAALLLDCVGTRWAGAGLTARTAHLWNDLERAIGQSPALPPWAAAVNAPVWRSRVPDVFGMQLLTDEHLSRAADLSHWTVTEVATGRHLVEAPDLADWFGPQGPSAPVLAAARADFGPVIAPADLSKD